jgi:large subunit ribosomal protein L21
VATVVGQKLGPKVVIFKKKRCKQYRRTLGHRQELTEVRIDRID